MTLGERLIALREEFGYSKRKDFAQYLGIPYTTLRNYETDTREPGHKFLMRISQIFDVSVDYLLCLTDKKTNRISDDFSEQEKNLITLFRNLNEEGKEIIIKHLEDLELSGRYKKDNQYEVVKEAQK